MIYLKKYQHTRPMEKILFTRQIFEMVDTAKVSNGEIFVMDADGSNEKRLTHKKAMIREPGFRLMENKSLFMVQMKIKILRYSR